MLNNNSTLQNSLLNNLFLTSPCSPLHKPPRHSWGRVSSAEHDGQISSGNCRSPLISIVYVILAALSKNVTANFNYVAQVTCAPRYAWSLLTLFAFKLVSLLVTKKSSVGALIRGDVRCLEITGRTRNNTWAPSGDSDTQRGRAIPWLLVSGP